MNILYIQESSQILSEEELLNLLGGAVDGDTIKIQVPIPQNATNVINATSVPFVFNEQLYRVSGLTFAVNNAGPDA